MYVHTFFSARFKQLCATFTYLTAKWDIISVLKNGIAEQQVSFSLALTKY